MDINFKMLTEPFPACDIEWRVQSSGKKGDKIWAKVLAYVTNRAIQQRLDDVCGPEKWRNEFAAAPDGGVMCEISIDCGDEWVGKWDGADNTQVEAVKGGLSSAMKRAAVQWGIGRYLYKLDVGWANVCSNGSHSDKLKDGTWFKWDPPVLPAWALPNNNKKQKPADSQNQINIENLVKGMISIINEAPGLPELTKWWMDHWTEISALPPKYKAQLFEAKDKMKKVFADEQENGKQLPMKEVV